MPDPSDQGDRAGWGGVDILGGAPVGTERGRSREGGICWEAPGPTPCASRLLLPRLVGWDPPGPEGQLRKALRPR